MDGVALVYTEPLRRTAAAPALARLAAAVCLLGSVAATGEPAGAERYF